MDISELFKKVYYLIIAFDDSSRVVFKTTLSQKILMRNGIGNGDGFYDLFTNRRISSEVFTYHYEFTIDMPELSPLDSKLQELGRQLWTLQ